MEWDDDNTLAGRYRLCQIGFALSGVALGLLSLSGGAYVALILTDHRGLLWIFDHPILYWGISAPVTVGSFVGSYLLWGRWRAMSWQRRAGLLVLMNGIDFLLWTKEAIERQPELMNGQKLPASPYEWTLSLLVMGMGWAELFLLASLAADVSGQLGNKASQETARAAKTLCMIGFALWGLLVVTQTNWNHWPLAPRLTVAMALLQIGSQFLKALAAFQVTVLCMSTARQCRRYARQLNYDDGHELLSSRSDDPDWGQDRDRW